MLQKFNSLLIVILIFSGLLEFANNVIAKDNSYIGQWVVSEVLVNEMQERRLYYNYNDPNLRWRILSISSNSLKGNLPEIFSMCKPLTIETKKMPAFALLKDYVFVFWWRYCAFSAI
jgi:hypothetical protein